MPPLTEKRVARQRKFDNTVGTKIRILRIKIDLEQQELARLADMSPSQLNRVEAGSRALKLREAIAIGKVFAIDPRDLAKEK